MLAADVGVCGVLVPEPCVDVFVDVDDLFGLVCNVFDGHFVSRFPASYFGSFVGKNFCVVGWGGWGCRLNGLIFEPGALFGCLLTIRFRCGKLFEIGVAG